MKFNTAGFDGCCSATILYGFSRWGQHAKYNTENGTLAQVAITKNTQKEAIAYLIKEKFTACAIFHAPRHGSILTLWVKKPLKARLITAAEYTDATTAPAPVVIKKKKKRVVKKKSLRG
jgi:hypothetical protein